MQGRCLHAKMHRKKRSGIQVVVQLLAAAWSALLKFIGLGSLHTAYWLYFVYDSETALLHALLSISDGISLRSQWEWGETLSEDKRKVE